MKHICMSHCAENTYKLGIKLGTLLKPGDVICLDGGLGAGKTLLTKGISVGIGIEYPVTSPTFTLINEYPGEVPLYHFDVYRLEDGDELTAVGGEEMLYGKGICVLEWASRVEDILPEQRLWVNISLCPGEYNKRMIEFIAAGNRYEKILEEVKKYEYIGN